MVACIALHSRDFDEPLDALEYLIITALGFAALENTLYILNPLLVNNSIQGLITGNERFIGATLVHVVSSALIGYCLARAFYMTKLKRMGLRILGISLAIALHTSFNVFIIRMQETNNDASKFIVFSAVWAMALVVLLLFEKIKRVKATP
jgi:RsiW-degrading membrane proteinase PrsW (M82 family)